MFNSILDELRRAENPAQKAAVIADSTIDGLSHDIIDVARSCVIFHWFNEKIIEAILPSKTKLTSMDVYKKICSLPFVEPTTHGAAYHDLTRRGLIDLYSAKYQDLFRASAEKAAKTYLTLGNDREYFAEAFYC